MRVQNALPRESRFGSSPPWNSAVPVKLIAAPHTPFDEQGNLNLAVVAEQAQHYRQTGVTGAFIAGSTGEGHSLTVAERIKLAEKWMEVAPQHDLQVIVHIGHNCQRDSIVLAEHAESIQAHAVGMLAPSYYKPASVEALVDFCAPVARAASSLPFYFYDIPSMTDVLLPMVEFLRQGSQQIPNLAGIKYTNSDLVGLQECLRFEDGRYEIWFGCDEALLAGYALGATGAVGSTYNFAASLYQRMIQSYDEGDFAAARRLQAQSVALVKTIGAYGYMGAAKSVMGMLGIDCGPARPPLVNPSAEQRAELRSKLDAWGLFTEQT